MARKSLIGDRERTAIARAFHDYPRGKAELIRLQAGKICGRDLGLSTVQRELAILRKKHPTGSTNPIDGEWSLGSLTAYPMPLEAIPLLLIVKETLRDNFPQDLVEFVEAKGRPVVLTIRLAIWIARIMAVPSIGPSNLGCVSLPPVTNPESHKVPSRAHTKWTKDTEILVNVAIWYATYEIGCELADISPINTNVFDAQCRELMWRNILEYQRPIDSRHGITDLDTLEMKERYWNEVGPRVIATEGRKRNARSHSKEI